VVTSRAPFSPRQIVLSALERADLDQVLCIERRSFAQPWSEELFRQELRLPFSRIVVARLSGDPPAVVGYVCRWLAAGELHLLNVAVHPDWRRRGIGRRLVEHVLEEARGAGAKRAFLEVRRYNVPAIALYERLGFRAAAVRRNYYGPGEDALIMEREISDDSPAA
jgi:ribosomal-protein-alanine N-acetyltransferase